MSAMYSVPKHDPSPDVVTKQTDTGSTRTWSHEEKIAFSMHVNLCLEADPDLSHLLPLDIESNDLFQKCSDGLILCKLINCAQFDAIDVRALNKKKVMNIYEKTENLNLAINAAKAIGCQVVNLGAKDIIEASPILILGVVWQIIRIQLLSNISLKTVPELALLLEEDETIQNLLKLQPEVILLRWMNYHLKKAGYPSEVKNFGSDVQDSSAYSALMHQLNPDVARFVTGTDRNKRAEQVIQNAKNMGVDVFISPGDIAEGNKKLNLSFVAQLFENCNGLKFDEDKPPLQDLQDQLAALELDDADGDNREERALRMWINSLNIDDVYINDLFTDLADGWIILKLCDHAKPGCVEWKKVNKDPKSRFKKVENGNYAVMVARDRVQISVVNCGGLDIVDGNKKIILGMVAQLMRKHTLYVLSNIAESSGVEITDEQIVSWANDRVAHGPRGGAMAPKMNNFKDKSLASGVFFLELLAAVEPRCINWEIATAGETKEQRINNARYAISSARKIGACVFLCHEDIVEVKAKMLLTFVASVWLADIRRSNNL